MPQVGTGLADADPVRYRELMHSHANPNRDIGEITPPHCSVAIQVGQP
jgi:hypothetical protein